MDTPRERLPRYLLFTVIGAFISMVFGLIGKALEPLVLSPGNWGEIGRGLIWFVGLFRFTASVWFLMPAALLTGAWGGIIIDRWLRKKEDQRAVRQQPETLSASVPDPVVTFGLNQKATRELDRMLAHMTSILGDRYRPEGDKQRTLAREEAEFDSFYISMRKAGYLLPPLYERDVFEYQHLWSVLQDLKPFIDRQHFDEAKERAAKSAEEVGTLLAGRHQRLAEKRLNEAKG